MNWTDPIPFEEALQIARQEGILPTTLGSAQIRSLREALRRRALFSAKLDRASVLQTLKKNLEIAAAGIEDEFGRTLSISEIKAQLTESLRAEGIWHSPAGTPRLQDITSDARRQLIVETNLLDTLGAARHARSQDPIALDMNPAWELVRVIEPTGGPQARRPWNARWAQAARATTEDGATTGLGRMVALKNHPIWQALGDGAGGYDDTLGNPWPPFAFNSGMNVIDVPRRDAIALGLMEDDTTIPPDTDPDSALTALDLQASAARFDPELQTALAQDPRLQLRDGILTLKNSQRATRNTQLSPEVTA